MSGINAGLTLLEDKLEIGHAERKNANAIKNSQSQLKRCKIYKKSKLIIESIR